MKTARSFPWKLFSRIVGVQAFALLLALGATGIAARFFFKREFLAQVGEQLHVSLGSLARDLPARVPPDWCTRHSVSPHQRLTVISDRGQVLCDSHHDPATMENHLERPEVRAALDSGFGLNTRQSATLHENMLYGALFVKEPRLVLRGSIPVENLISALSVFDTSLAMFLLIVALMLVGFAVWSGRRLAYPIGRILLKARNGTGELAFTASQSDESYGELSELENSIDDIRRDLEAKAESLHREREEHATLMRAISDAILAVDSDGLPLYFNSRFAVLFGKGAALQDGKTRLWELFRNPELLEAFRTALKKGKQSTVNAVALDQDGTQKFFSLSVSPLLRPLSHVVYGAVGVFHDVSELKKAEQMRIDFVANVSHELRTPLTAIKGYSDTLGADLEAGQPASRDFVSVIQRNTERLMSLINDLLDLSSLDANIDELHRSQVGTSELSERALKQLERRLAEKQQAVEVQAGAASVFADPGRLEQVLVNLVDNAAKYSPFGAKIRVSWKSEGSGGVALSVADSGAGIAPEHLDRLFERFYRVDKARSRELGGTGLGLAIVKHILQRHGGLVWVESEVGKGSVFHCVFPSERL